jgi:hypothetical protein
LASFCTPVPRPQALDTAPLLRLWLRFVIRVIHVIRGFNSGSGWLRSVICANLRNLRLRSDPQLGSFCIRAPGLWCRKGLDRRKGGAYFRSKLQRSMCVKGAETR